MKTEYDRRADAAYFAFSSADPVRQVKLDDSRIIDHAADGSLVGAEILSPSRGVDRTGLPRVDEIAGGIRALGFRALGAERSARTATPR